MDSRGGRWHHRQAVDDSSALKAAECRYLGFGLDYNECAGYELQLQDALNDIAIDKLQVDDRWHMELSARGARRQWYHRQHCRRPRQTVLNNARPGREIV